MKIRHFILIIVALIAGILIGTVIERSESAKEAYNRYEVTSESSQVLEPNSDDLNRTIKISTSSIVNDLTSNSVNIRGELSFSDYDSLDSFFVYGSNSEIESIYLLYENYEQIGTKINGIYKTEKQTQLETKGKIHRLTADLNNLGGNVKYFYRACVELPELKKFTIEGDQYHQTNLSCGRMESFETLGEVINLDEESFRAVNYDEYSYKISNKRIDIDTIVEDFLIKDKNEYPLSSKDIEGVGPDVYKVTLVYIALDDSVAAEKYVFEIEQIEDYWDIYSLKKNFSCQPGRGHQDWGIENCI